VVRSRQDSDEKQEHRFKPVQPESGEPSSKQLKKPDA